MLEIRALLNTLRGVIDPGTVCRICEVDRDDLELLALVETELQPTAPQEDS